MTKLNEGDRVRIIYGQLQGFEGVLKHIGNLFGDGDRASLDVGQTQWIDLPVKQIRRL